MADTRSAAKSVASPPASPPSDASTSREIADVTAV
jgi:hypothetical protein